LQQYAADVTISSMVDLIALVLAFVVVLVVMLRRTSAGMAILAILAGVMLDQLLAKWIIGLLPNTFYDSSKMIPVIIHILLTFIPVVVVLITAKVAHHSTVLSLLTSLVLGFLIFSFGLQIFDKLPELNKYTSNSGLLHFVGPYSNAILASSAVLALVEMSNSHKTAKIKNYKSKKGKH